MNRFFAVLPALLAAQLVGPIFAQGRETTHECPSTLPVSKLLPGTVIKYGSVPKDIPLGSVASTLHVNGTPREADTSGILPANLLQRSVTVFYDLRAEKNFKKYQALEARLESELVVISKSKRNGRSDSDRNALIAYAFESHLMEKSNGDLPCWNIDKNLVNFVAGASPGKSVRWPSGLDMVGDANELRRSTLSLARTLRNISHGLGDLDSVLGMSIDNETQKIVWGKEREFERSPKTAKQAKLDYFTHKKACITGEIEKIKAAGIGATIGDRTGGSCQLDEIIKSNSYSISLKMDEPCAIEKLNFDSPKVPGVFSQKTDSYDLASLRYNLGKGFEIVPVCSVDDANTYASAEKKSRSGTAKISNSTVKNLPVSPPRGSGPVQTAPKLALPAD